MFLRTHLLAFFLLYTFFTYSQINPKTPSWVNIEELNKSSSINPDEVRDGYYYMLLDEQYNTILKHNYFHYATKIISETGLDYASQIEVSYDPSYQKVEIHHIKIHRGNQTINKAIASEIKVLTEEKNRGQGILNGYKTLYTNLSGVKKGDIIEYDYSIIGYNKIFNGKINFDLNVGYSVPVGKVMYRLIFPKTELLNIKNVNTDIKPIIKTEVYNDYLWSLNQPKILKVEESIPSWYDPYPTVQVSTVNSWPEVKNWFAQLFNTIEANDKLLQETVNLFIKKFQIKTNNRHC